MAPVIDSRSFLSRAAGKAGSPDQRYARHPAFGHQQLVAADALVGHIAGLPKPVLLAALATNGYIAAWWRDGLSARAIAAWDHNVANGQAGLARQLDEPGIADSDLVLVETTQVRLYVPAAALRYWIRSYRIDILWSLVALAGDARARARLLLGRGDGSSSPGGGCTMPGQRPRYKPGR